MTVHGTSNTGNGEPTQWRHPTDDRIVLSGKIVTAIALMQMGVSDYVMIASATGLNEEEIQQIDNADDPVVRKLALAGIPEGEYFKLQTRTKCPRCNRWTDTAPCIACAHDHSKQ